MPCDLRAPALLLCTIAACADGDATAPGIDTGQDSLPPAGAAYRGAAPHRFLGGNAELTCSSHDQFTGAVPPPTSQGGMVTADYVATFSGQLILTPPLVPSTVTHPLVLQAHIVEQITLAGIQAAVRTFDTELLAFELGGSTAPAGAMVRESPTLASTGRTTVTTLSSGRFRIETFYDVWLEISLDGGSTWHPAETAVRMTLGPAGGR